MNIFKKIEKFLSSISIIASIFSRGELNQPKKNDYLGRVVLSLAGLIIIFLLLIVPVLMVIQWISELFQ